MKLSAAFKKLLFSSPKHRTAPGRPQGHETSLRAAGRQQLQQPRRDGGHGRGSTGPSPLPATPAVLCRET